MSQAEGNLQSGASSQASQASQPASASSATTVPTSDNARHRRKIADLEVKLQVLESGQAVKKRSERYRSYDLVRYAQYFQGDRLYHVTRTSYPTDSCII
jgi:hypothetical protein